MVGPGLKKYAQEKGLKVSNGVAYGVINGYMVTLVDGADIKKVSFSCAVTDDAAGRLRFALDEKSFKKQYRIAQVEILRESVTVVFGDTIGTMKKLSACMEVLPQKLKECGAIGDGFCTACGNNIDITEAHNIVLINGIAHRIHAGCAGGVNQRAEIEEDIYKNEEKKLGRGILGALLGAAAGGIVWAVAYYLGWFFALIGVLIAFLAKKGYELLGGKVCKAKTVIVLLSTVFGAVFGQVMGDLASIAMEIPGTDYTIIDVPFLYVFILAEQPDVLQSTLINLGMGLFFALLGGYGILRKTHTEDKTATLKSIVLE